MDTRFNQLLCRWRDAEHAASGYAAAHRIATAPHHRFIADQLRAVARRRYARLQRAVQVRRRSLPQL